MLNWTKTEAGAVSTDGTWNIVRLKPRVFQLVNAKGVCHHGTMKACKEHAEQVATTRQEEIQSYADCDERIREAVAEGRHDPVGTEEEEEERIEDLKNLPEAPGEEETVVPVIVQKGGQHGSSMPYHAATEEAVEVENKTPTPLVRNLSGLASKLAIGTKVVEDSSPHLIIEARAGTGKTTTLIEGLKRVKGIASTMVPSEQQAAIWDLLELSRGVAKSICFVAFNKSIASELKTRVPVGCDAMTMHGMGFRAVQRAFNLTQGREVQEGRVGDIICRILGQTIWELRKSKPILLKAVSKLVSLCKMNLTDLDLRAPGESDDGWNEQELGSLASHYEVELNHSRAEIFGLVPKVLEACRDVARDGCIDFDDMVWLPVALDLPVTRYDLLLVDEAQDLNRCQQALAKKAGRRLVLCGDPRQAIYGFAGADAESMPRMAKELATMPEATVPVVGIASPPRGCVTLPLTVTRRCGRAIVEEARKIVPDFSAHESNPDGLISQALYTHRVAAGTDRLIERPIEETYIPTVREGDMILCRVNAPLVSQCFTLLRRGVKANIQGRDIGQGLISTITKMKCERTVDLVAKLAEWEHSEVAKEQAKAHPSEAKIIAVCDRVDCITSFAEGVGRVDEVIRRIEAVFTDDPSSVGVRLSSIHKAKGLEARKVYFLQPPKGSCPHPMARTNWAREQEQNLKYVGITRAIEELVWVY